MLHAVMRPYTTLGLKFFFRKIYLTGRENIPQDKPVIFAANHPTAFLEPIILAGHQNRPLYYLVRGDFFKRKIFKIMLNSLHMVPIFRFRDGGHASIKANYDTFRFCYDTLHRNRPVMILIEGRSEHEKKLRPLMKGTARISFGAIEAYKDMDLYIVPVGVNYTYADQFRNTAMLEFGKPFRVRDFLDEYEENETKAVVKLTERIRRRLEKQVIIIDRDEDVDLVENLFVLSRNEHRDKLFPIVSGDSGYQKREKTIADTVNGMDDASKTTLKAKVDAYFRKLKSLGVTDFGLMNKDIYNGISWLKLILGFVPAILGAVLNFIPFMIARHFMVHKVTKITFRSPVGYGAGIGAWLVYLLIWLIIAAVRRDYFVLLVAVLIPVLGYFALVYWEFYLDFTAARRAAKLDKKTTLTLMEMREMCKLNGT